MNEEKVTPVMARRRTARGKQALSSDAFDNQQLSLFQSFLCNTEDERTNLSNTVDLWDSVPRYSVSQQAMNKLRTPQGFLENLEIPFKYRQIECAAIIQPARIKDRDGVSRHYYPSANEELIEDALRKLAADQEQGFFDRKDRPSSGVVFTLYALRDELGRRGHARGFYEIVQSLRILSGSTIELRSDEKSARFAISAYFPFLGGITREDLADNPGAKWVVQFHPLVTQSVADLTYRQYNYHLMMSHSTQLTRWLHKQLSLKFTFAALGRAFEMRYSTIKRDSALLGNYKQERDAIAVVTNAFDELQKAGALMEVRAEKIKGARGKIEDVAYTLLPSPSFIAEAKAANKRNDLAKLAVEGAGVR